MSKLSYVSLGKTLKASTFVVLRVVYYRVVVGRKEMSDWYLPYTDGYTGPYYSDGKFQSSVANGKFKPRGRLGEFSRDHDTAYKLCQGDFSCNDAADREYFRKTQEESWAYLPIIPRLIGAIPLAAHNPMGLMEEIFLKRKTKNNKSMGLVDDLLDILNPSRVREREEQQRERAEKEKPRHSRQDVVEKREQDEQTAYAPVSGGQIKETVYLPFERDRQLDSTVYSAVGRTNFNVRPFKKSKY